MVRASAIAVLLVASVAHPAVSTPPVPVLIVADERPAMEVLARELASRAHLASEIAAPDVPVTAFAGRRAVIVYIHKDLPPAIEHAALAHARAGGTLILLHHAISSHKRANQEWLPALGVTLPASAQGTAAYRYVAPDHPVVAHDVRYPTSVDGRPAFTLSGTEVYLNHVLAGPRTVLLALRYQDAKTGTLYRQDTAGWTLPLGRGQVYYFMPGHLPADFEDPSYAQILANAVASARSGNAR